MPMLAPTVDLMAVEIVGAADRLDDARRQRRGGHRLLAADLDDGELVAAQPGDRIRLSRCSRAAARRPPSAARRRRMAERVVDLLEAVEVEAEHRHALSRRDA